MWTSLCVVDKLNTTSLLIETFISNQDGHQFYLCSDVSLDVTSTLNTS